MSTSPLVSDPATEVKPTEEKSSRTLNFCFAQNPLIDNDVDQEGTHGERTVGPTVVQSTERVVTPIQLPVDRNGAGRSSLASRYNQPADAGTKTAFAVVRSTAIQQTIGHPLAYVRVLMQVSDDFLRRSSSTLVARRFSWATNP